MTRPHHSFLPVLLAVVALTAVATGAEQSSSAPTPAEQPFRFRSGVDLVNVTVTVADSTGRFVRGLKKEDFVVYEDGEPQTVSHFSSDRVPVSLGIALDTSASMAGPKFSAAQAALNRFLDDLLDPSDEIFLYRFSDEPKLLQDWTTNRRALHRALASASPRGQTAMYDAVAESVLLAQTGQHRKKALVIISDGNDTSSRTPLTGLKQLIRESEVLVYAIGIDTDEASPSTPRPPTWTPPNPPRTPVPVPRPFPIPGGRRSMSFLPAARSQISQVRPYANSDRVNAAALREMTDDSGGRTEIVRSARDLDPATAGVADELSRQYFLGYPAAAGKDGRWHSIRVEVRNQTYRVRARRGYVAN